VTITSGGRAGRVLMYDGLLIPSRESLESTHVGVDDTVNVCTTFRATFRDRLANWVGS
jgi:hypothetical protein